MNVTLFRYNQRARAKKALRTCATPNTRPTSLGHESDLKWALAALILLWIVL